MQKQEDERYHRKDGATLWVQNEANPVLASRHQIFIVANEM